MKKPVIIAIVIAIVLVVILGVAIFINSNREDSKEKIIEVHTAEDFKSAMEEKQHIVMDSTKQFENYENIKQLYIATNADYSYKIEFYELSDDEYATKFYNTNKYNFQKSKTESDTETSTDLENGLKYTLLSDSKYKVVARKSNTIVYLDVDVSYKDTIDNILNGIGF